MRCTPGVFFIVSQRSSRCPYTLLLIELPTPVFSVTPYRLSTISWLVYHYCDRQVQEILNFFKADWTITWNKSALLYLTSFFKHGHKTNFCLQIWLGVFLTPDDSSNHLIVKHFDDLVKCSFNLKVRIVSITHAQ